MIGKTITVTDEKQRAFTTKFDAEGRFSFPNLSPGRYSIKATAPSNAAPLSASGAGNGALELVPNGCTEVAFSTYLETYVQDTLPTFEAHPY